MQITPDASATLYFRTWIGLGIVFAYYISVVAVFQLRRRHATLVTRYDPPPEISPAVAAHLWANGLHERAFASALVSLASKSYLHLGQNGDQFIFKKKREADVTLPPEEYATLLHLFNPGEHTYIFGSVEYGRLCNSYAEFKDALKDVVEPVLISSHSNFWWLGMVFSGLAIVPLAGTMVAIGHGVTLASVVYLGIWILLGGSSLVATLRVWPAALHKLTSYIPWDDRPSRPLHASDIVPLTLSASAFLALIFLAVLTSTSFAFLIAAVVLLNAVFRHALESPTRAGCEVLAELTNFREFLSSADSGRLNRENQAGFTPMTLEKYSAYAIALHVEHAWGEELVTDLVELLEIGQAYAQD
jgi:hypothetical protein